MKESTTELKNLAQAVLEATNTFKKATGKQVTAFRREGKKEGSIFSMIEFEFDGKPAVKLNGFQDGEGFQGYLGDCLVEEEIKTLTIECELCVPVRRLSGEEIEGYVKRASAGAGDTARFALQERNRELKEGE